jgi:membrane-anchored protein YejM (alkaline phosphatase superfamily)
VTAGATILPGQAAVHLLKERQKDSERYGSSYPLGLPDAASEPFLLPDVVEGAIDLLKGIQQPALVYLHFYSPHEPYTPSSEFYGCFLSDGWVPPYKPVHELSDKKLDSGLLQIQHRNYDEYIASWDHEVARLFSFLTESGLAEDSYIFITSDHGELFERGGLGHWTKLIYDPVIYVPLIVHKPRAAGP